MFKSIENAVAARISPTRAHWSGLKEDFAARLQNFRAGRGREEQTALERDFRLVLTVWGIEHEEAIPAILRDLRLRCRVLGFAAVFVLAAALLMPGLYSLLTLILVAPPCLLGILIARWRMSILRNRAFRPLLRRLPARFIPKKRSVL